jgi:hypothetical protein
VCDEGLRRLLISKRGDAIRSVQQGLEITTIATAIGRRPLSSPSARIYTEGEQGVEPIFG